MNFRTTPKEHKYSDDGKYIYLSFNNIIKEGDELQLRKDGLFTKAIGFIGKKAEEVEGYPDVKVRRKIDK